ncbi:hypothetical protein KIW84_063431 [Lathyrus oleraceus]|uniref:GAGA-binding transcriptional activator n=1 Tax=Pisum sativum TaxID=3888 RepID=A0A9D5A790_PEA|nr:hypothetical protein KIW84_063431 [Pisum sativum]
MAERQATILEIELEAAISEKNEALAAQDVALRQRDEALAQRDNALLERDNALAALQCRNSSANFSFNGGNHCGSKRMHRSSNHHLSNKDCRSSSKFCWNASSSIISISTQNQISNEIQRFISRNKKKNHIKVSPSNLPFSVNASGQFCGVAVHPIYQETLSMALAKHFDAWLLIVDSLSLPGRAPSKEVEVTKESSRPERPVFIKRSSTQAALNLSQNSLDGLIPSKMTTNLHALQT